MEENQHTNQSNTVALPRDGVEPLMVKDLDGRFKVFSGGELAEIDEMLDRSVVAQADEQGARTVSTELTLPKFTDLAVTPEDVHFAEGERSEKNSGIASLQFHPDDHQEIQRELGKISKIFGSGSQKQYSIDKIARKLIDKNDLHLSNNAATVFAKALLTFFRGIRNTVETREVLLKGTAEGGLGLTGETADRVLSVARHLRQRIEAADGVVVETDVAEPAPKREAPPTPQDQPPKPLPQMPTIASARPSGSRPAVSATKEPSAESKPPTPAPKQHSPAPTTPPTPATKEAHGVPAPVSESARPSPPASRRPSEPAEPISAVREQSDPMPRIARPRGARPTAIHDVQHANFGGRARTKLTGRVDELQAMDLETWRLLDENPRIRAGKILGKIQNLEQESYTRKSQGISAWRESQVYQLYLQIGQRSLEEKKNVEQVIHDLEAAGEQTLTLNEFEAVTDLNRTMRF